MIGPQFLSPELAIRPAQLPGMGATVQGGRETKVRETAREFEATFLAMVLKEMRQSLEEGLFPGDSGDVQGGLFDLYLGRHLADGGGVGLADSLARHMTPAPVTAPHGPRPADSRPPGPPA